MARAAVGSLAVDTRGKSVTYRLRVRVDGRRHSVPLGSEAEGWTRARAEGQLELVKAQIKCGIWQPPDRTPIAAPEMPEDPTFHEFASAWFKANEGAWRPNTRLAYQWELSNHLLPFFADHRLSKITIAEVDRFREVKVREGKLSGVSINKCLVRLGQILDVADERDLIERNPLRVNPKNRKAKVSKPSPIWLDRAEHIASLLDAAGDLDRAARRDRQHIPRRAILATLALAGLRLGELLDLRWRDLDLAAGTITVRAAKTAAGVRQVSLLPALRDELGELKAAAEDIEPNDLVFGTSHGKRQSASNIRNRVLGPAVTLANERLIEAGDVPLPEGVSPHKLRHTFASVLVSLGVDVGAVMDELGHTSPNLCLHVYRHSMRRDQASRDALRALVGGPVHTGDNVMHVDLAAAING